MKIAVYALDGKKGADANLPAQFTEPLRLDLIKRAVLSLQSKARTPYGAFEDAGDRHSVDVSRRRRDYRGSYGKGISRVPRKVHTRRGSQMFWVGARAPGMRGGRRAHPPKAEKDWTRAINKKENRKAIRSAIAATVNKELVAKRGHKLPTHYPFLVADKMESIKTTKELLTALSALGFTHELERASVTGRRTGAAALRGRSKKTKQSLLIVTAAKSAAVTKAARNILGVAATSVSELNAEILAPGTHAGRITLFTDAAVKKLAEENLFV